MKTYGFLAILLFSGATTVSAQQVDLAAFQALEAEVAALRNQVGQDYCDQGGCAPCCSPCCYDSGLYGGAEIGFLVPHGMAVHVANSPAPYRWDPGSAGRFWLGYRVPNGLGLQARVWGFDHAATGPNGVGGAIAVGMDTAIFDLEFSHILDLNPNWDAMITAGYRHLDIEVDIASVGIVDFNQRIQYSGDGMTVSAELRRPVRGNLTLFGNVRASLVFGDSTDNYVSPTSAYTDVYNQMSAYIFESQLGIEWQRPLSVGGVFFARAAVEGQHWEYTFGSLGLFGGSFALGIQR